MPLPGQRGCRTVIGQTIRNRYTLTACIGSGATGTVYRAADSQTKQDVAIKVISRELTLNPATIERFRREGEVLRQLRHPNIVGFVDAFQHDEQYVIVMEYIGGGSLRGLIQQGPLPHDRTRQIALDLCDALTHAHSLNIIHRDLKPEKVLFAEDGAPKLADFGIAKLMDEASRLTGMQVGAPYYMSPEAWEGRALDTQADIWSLGVVIYEMLTGEVPFGGATLVAVMNNALNAPLPDLKTKRADIPDRLTQIVNRMLARDKTKRYATIRQVAADLELASGAAVSRESEEVANDAREESKKKAGAERRKGNASWMPAVLVGVVVIGLIGAAILLNNQIASTRSLQFPSAVVLPTSTPRPTATLDLEAAATLQVAATQAIAVLTPSPTPTPTLRPAQIFAEPILKAIANRPPDFSDDFSKPSSGWALGPLSDANKNPMGDRGYKDGEYFLESLPNQVMPARRNDLIYSDFVAKVDVRFISGSASSLWAFEFRSDYRLYYGMDGRMGLAAGLRGIKPSRSLGSWGPFRSGLETTQLLVIARGLSIYIYLNGEEAAFVRDEAFTDTRAAMDIWVASNDPQKGARIHLDNFKIWDISNLP